MKPFDYVVVFISILVSLAIADLTISTHRLLRGGRRVAWHWAAPACAVLAALAVLRHFWVFYGIYHDQEHLMLMAFLPVVGALVLMFLAAAASLPDEVPAGGLDLRAFYINNRFHFWGLTALWLVWLVAYNAIANVIQGAALSPLLMTVNGIAIAIAVSLIFVRRLWWHAVGIALLFAGSGWNWMRLTIG